MPFQLMLWKYMLGVKIQIIRDFYLNLEIFLVVVISAFKRIGICQIPFLHPKFKWISPTMGTSQMQLRFVKFCPMTHVPWFHNIHKLAESLNITQSNFEFTQSKNIAGNRSQSQSWGNLYHKLPPGH